MLRTLISAFVLALFCLPLFPLADQQLTLPDLLQMAVKNHPLLRQSQAGINQEKGVETEVRSAELPQLNFNNSYQKANSRGSSFGVSTAFTTYDSAFTLNQLITDFGKTGAKIQASALDVSQAEENYRNAYEQVLFNVYQDYDQVLANRAVVKVQEDSVNNLKEHLKQTRAFFTVGTHPKIDVTQAEVNLANGRLSLVQARNNLDISETNLENAVGTPGISFSNLQGTLTYASYPITLEDALNAAYSTRPDLKALEDQLASAKASLSAASKGENPTLAASASYGWISETFPPLNNTWGYGLTLDFPLFNGFLTQGETEAARAQVDQVSAQIDNLKLTIRQNVEQAYLNLQSARMSLNVAEDSLRYARENFHLAQGRYNVGVGNYLEYSDAQFSLVQAETNEIQSLSSYNIAVASLRQSMGILNVAGH